MGKPQNFSDPKFLELQELRMRHGFAKERDKKAAWWSKGKLYRGVEAELPAQQDGFPRNALLLNALCEKYAGLGFRWEEQEKERFTYRWSQEVKSLQRYVTYENYPKVGGIEPSLLDLWLMPIELADGYWPNERVRHLLSRVGKSADISVQMARMNETGIGYMGISGVAWLPAVEPFTLPAKLESELLKLGNALFLFYDAIQTLLDKDEELGALLRHKIPSRIPQLMESGTVDLIRPDIVIVDEGDSNYRFVITELESAPAGHGMMHALQVGYGLPCEMLERFIEYLDGRLYLILMTHEWVEYLWEQAVFCKALQERGVDARILIDRPLSEVHERVQSAWTPPKDAPPRVIENWNTDLIGRLREHGFADIVKGFEELPQSVGGAVVFRFGYFDNLQSHVLERMRAWQAHGATIINPLQYALENKALMAARRIPAVRQWIADHNSSFLEILDRCIAETRLLGLGTDGEELRRDRVYWLTKFGAWDGNNQSWGSRSLHFGSQMRPREWEASLRERLALPFPVVAQHQIVSARFDCGYMDYAGNLRILLNARTRLTPYFLRGKQGTLYGGSILTLRSDTLRIHAATDAVEVPVVFNG